MPKRTDIQSILVLGAGPILIGQACEFDYAGSQACLALNKCGYRVILVNPNPATIMTDPEFADSTYIEPLTVESVTRIIKKEKPSAVLPTIGGQTALNLVVALEESGVLEKYNVQIIGSNLQSIKNAENRKVFHEIIEKMGLNVPRSYTVSDSDAAIETVRSLGFPIMMRPSFILGGAGTGIVKNEGELLDLWDKSSSIGPIHEVTLEESLYGWKEFELEVLRDQDDNCIVVCAIENFDPLGVHTGDSITVAPIQTLTDKEYQKMRLAAFDIIRAVGLEAGGANVQFAVNPNSGRMVVIEMNPRVSRSSALASKVTGFPIAKVAAQLAVGYTLSELSSDIVGSQIPASFEPTIDNVVVKIPCFQFEKFQGYQDVLTTQMQSVGEAMAIGRTFVEALQKCMRSVSNFSPANFENTLLSTPNSRRVWYIFDAFRRGLSVEEVYDLTKVDRWFLNEILQVVLKEKSASFSRESITEMKRCGFSDCQLGVFLGCSEENVRAARRNWDIKPVFKRVDGCSAEFSTSTVYSYSTYEMSCEAFPTENRKILVVGSGPNRIGQGIEFDYACVHAVKTLKSLQYETIMVNCNPETVSTDYDFSDRLYCSPLTLEDMLSIVDIEQPNGVLLQLGGQIPLNLAKALDQNGVSLLGLNLTAIDLCENRDKFQSLLKELGLKYPKSFTFYSKRELPSNLTFPLIVRPSYVLGGRSMRVVKNYEELQDHLNSIDGEIFDSPVIVERFLEGALEVEVDAISDGNEVFVPSIMEQIQPAGVHSGDSTCYIPPRQLSPLLQRKLIEISSILVRALEIKGFINIQFAVLGGEPYIIEANPRCSRTIPFLSKALGLDLVDIATKCILGETLPIGVSEVQIKPKRFFVKEPVFSVSRFQPAPRGPEMQSTGEVMGIGSTFQVANNKAMVAAENGLDNSMVSDEVVSLQELSDLSAIENKR